MCIYIYIKYWYYIDIRFNIYLFPICPYVDVGLYTSTLDRMWVTRDHVPKGINWGPCFSRLGGSLLWTALLLSHFQDKRAPHIKTSWILLPVSHMRIQSRYNQMSQFINLYKWNPKVEGLSVFVMTNRLPQNWTSSSRLSRFWSLLPSDGQESHGEAGPSHCQRDEPRETPKKWMNMVGEWDQFLV